MANKIIKNTLSHCYDESPMPSTPPEPDKSKSISELSRQELFSFTMGNCVTVEDTNGNRKLLKKHREEKIDAVSALLDAYVAYKLNKDEFE